MNFCCVFLSQIFLEMPFPARLFVPIIITYQEKSGNYNVLKLFAYIFKIITYQEKSGNYNKC